jgi:SPP1 family predicted phage head-tail adaptor
MTAGKMDRRIRIERATATDDGFTSAGTVTWSLLAEVWAEVTPISDGERWRAGEVAAHVTHRFRIRYSSTVAGITPADRIIYQGDAFNISGVKEIGRRQKLEITASARADT